MPYVTGAAILQHVAKSGAPSDAAPDEAWADMVAAAIEADIALRLGDTVPGAGFTDALEVAALQDGAAAYMARGAPHGVLSVGPDGDAVRLGADIERALPHVLARYLASGGIGIG